MFCDDHIIFTKPLFNEKPSAWMEHIPFAFFLTKTLKPNLFVELGTQWGNSYFSFCQAITLLGFKTRAYGIDVWPSFNGLTGQSIFHYALGVNDKHFGHFSNLLKMPFDEAGTYFGNNSIDLLHIDGLHDYASVKHDFELWLPKMSESGVILFHDTMVRTQGFGVWKLMEEIKVRYPFFEFLHGNGLAVVCTGKSIPSDFLNFIEEANRNSFTQGLFSSLGENIRLRHELGQEKSKQIAASRS